MTGEEPTGRSGRLQSDLVTRESENQQQLVEKRIVFTESKSATASSLACRVTVRFYFLTWDSILTKPASATAV